MNQLLTKIGPLLKRTFHTNALTTLGGLVCLLGVLLLVKKFIDQQTMLEMLGSGGTIIGLGAKDGVRDGAPNVAPESLDAPDVKSGATPVAGLLLLLSLASLSACGSPLSHPSQPNPLRLATSISHPLPDAPAGRLLQQPVPMVYEATPDSLVPPAWYHGPAYLAPPPAGLTKRQVRQFRRAQRRAMVVGARTTPAKVKQGDGSAYAAADGTAVALRKPAGPTAVGQDNSATDNSKAGQHANGGVGTAGADWLGTAGGAVAPPKTSWFHGLLAGIERWGLVILGVVFFAGLAWLRFGPVGSSIKLAAAAARLGNSRAS